MTSPDDAVSVILRVMLEAKRPMNVAEVAAALGNLPDMGRPRVAYWLRRLRDEHVLSASRTPGYYLIPADRRLAVRLALAVA